MKCYYHKDKALLLFFVLFLCSTGYSCAKDDAGKKGGNGDATYTIAHGGNLVLGNPGNASSNVNNANNYLIEKPQYSLSYNDAKQTPNWVSWYLTSSDIGTTERQNSFKSDPSLPATFNKVVTSDYTSTGFDRGHMCPSADRTKSDEDNAVTFYMTNIIPQSPNNNRGTWENIESYCRELLNSNTDLYIISGPYGQGGVGSNGGANTIGNGIVVPNQVWKIIVLIKKNADNNLTISSTCRVIAVMTPNNQESTSKAWGDYRVSVDYIENLTGYNFLSELPDNIENAIESRVDGVAIE